MNKLFIFIGLQRCGTHALSNWLLKQREYETGTLENLGEDIFSLQNDNKKLYLFNHQKIDYPLDKQRSNTIDKLDTNCDAIICIEDGPLYEYKEDNLLQGYFQEHEIYRIISLRDAWNCFASFYKKYNLVDPHIIRGWEGRAEEIEGRTKFLEKDFHVIKYNEWFKNKDYRSDICKKFGLHFSDCGIDDVLEFGNGSSFDKTRMHGSGSNMSVLSRYREFETDRRFLRYMNPHIQLISRRIFGYDNRPDE